MCIRDRYQAATGATRNVRVAAEYTNAIMLAESVMAEHIHVTEENYTASGQFEAYKWSVFSWPALYDDGRDATERAVLPVPLQYLQVVVSWPGQSRVPREIDLLTVVPLQSPTSSSPQDDA